MSDYKKIYDSLIEKFRLFPPTGEYSELHHIIPRCIGGSDDILNLVALPAREHFVAHLLLAKIHGGKLVHAAYRMSNYRKYGSRRYAWIKRRHSELTTLAMTGRRLPPESYAKSVETRRRNGRYAISESTRAKMSKNAIRRNSGRITSQETRDKIAASLRGRKLPAHRVDAMRIRMTGADNPFYGKKHTPQTIAKLVDSMRGRIQSESTRTKRSASLLGNSNARRRTT